MPEINRLRFILGENFTGKKQGGENLIDSPSIFFKPEDLFQEGMTKNEFVDKYEQLMAISIFGMKQNSDSDSFDLSSVSDSDLSEIDEVAKLYFESIDKDNNGKLSEDEIEGLSSKDGNTEELSNEDIENLTNELFKELLEPTEENIIETVQSKNNNANIHSGAVTGGNNQFNMPTQNNQNNQNSGTLQNNNNTSSSKAENVNKRIAEINNEITSLNEQKQTEMANNAEYVSLISQSQDFNKDIFASEKKIEDFKGELQTVQYDLAAATSELNNTRDAEIFKEYQSTIDARRNELQSKISSLQQQETTLQNKISEEEQNLKTLNSKKEENDTQIKEIEKANLNTNIDTINGKINELNQEKAKLQSDLATARKDELSDAEVYGKSQAYRNSELVSRLLNPLLTKETKAKYDEYYKKTHGYSYCDQFIRNGINDFYSDVLAHLGISSDKLNRYTATENGILQNAGINKSNVAGNEYIRECQETKTWGKDYQAILNSLGINMTSSVDISNMSEAERRNAVKDGKIYPGMTFLTVKDGKCHVGFIESINKDLSWNTIEGNTFVKHANGSSETGTVGSHKSDATNQYLQGLSDIMAKVFFWMKMQGYSNSEINKYMAHQA